MTNQTAVTILKNLEQSLDDYCELNDEGKEAFHMAITALELFGNSEQLELTQKRKRGHWIPTSKERPPQHQELWITDVYGDVEVVYRGDGRLWHSNGDNGYYFEDEIIAWMPASVPEPYQPEEESE